MVTIRAYDIMRDAYRYRRVPLSRAKQMAPFVEVLVGRQWEPASRLLRG